MNESTFETQLASSLEKIFPSTLSARIETQRVFTLNFGHGVLKIDGPASYATGRADVILRLDNKAVILLELKRPGLEISTDDVTQGISYACVHSPMIPIVVITNGVDVRIHSSFDRSKMGAETLDEQRIATILQIATKRAALSREEAIRSLLEGSTSAWTEALRARTRKTLNELKGPMEDLTRPLCFDFRFPRRATAALAGALAVGERSMALVGPPISGKTNVLAELCERSEEFEIAPLYIDCEDADDLLEELSLALSDSFGTTIPPNKIFNWLRIGAGDVRDGRPRLVLILDSLIPEESTPLRKQATSLLRNVGPNVAILFSLTETGFERVRITPGRLTTSKLGRDIKIVPLEKLDEDEIDTASRNLYRQTKIVLPPGAQFEIPMHQPRTIRLMIAMNEHLRDIPDGHYGRLPSIVSCEVLAKLWENTSANFELRSDLLKLAHAYVNDRGERSKDAKLALTSLGVGTMTLTTVEKTLDGASFERLHRQGYIKRLPLTDRMLVVPTVPELLSAALIGVLKSIVIDTGSSEGHDAATEQLLRYTVGLALGDRVAALLLQQLIQEDSELFLAIFDRLMHNEPKEVSMTEGHFLIQSPFGGEPAEMRYTGNSLSIRLSSGKELTFPSDGEDALGKMTSNLHAWNILSHLAYSPIFIENENGTALLGVAIMAKLGRYRSTLKDFGAAQFGSPASTYEHDLPGFGRVPCPSRGIVEPIVYAMQSAIQYFGGAMDEFVTDAIREGNPALLMRLHIAASSLEEISDPETHERAARINRETSAALDEVLRIIHGSDEELE
jgi:hypothetical protein